MLLLALDALAQTQGPPGGCPELHLVQFEDYLDDVDAEFRALRFDRAARLLDAGYPRLPCLREVVPPRDLADYAIRRAWAFALAMDPSESERWSMLARAIDPRIKWPTYVPLEHAVRGWPADPPPPARRTDAALTVPADVAVFLDGRYLTVAAAEPELPHLLQLRDREGRIVEAAWQDGTSFPADVLGPPSAIGLTPAWSAPESARSGRFTGAAIAGAAAAALYGTAWVARAAYDRNGTDALFYTVDGATLAAGGAALTAGVLTVVAVARPQR